MTTASHRTGTPTIGRDVFARRAGIVAALPACMLANAALAQPEADDAGYARILEEVIVTAQKREEGLREVPISIAVVDGDTIEDNLILELEDLSAQVPGFTVTEAAISTLVFVRGLGSGINQGFEQSVGMYVDGVYAGRGRQYRASFLDVERVELLRGPQGTLFGKNTIAGAINISTRQPTDDFESSFTAGMDADDGERQFMGVVSGPLARDLSGRLAFKLGRFDGWTFNSFTGRDEAAVDDLAIRGSMRWTPTDRLSLTLKLEHSEYDVDGRTTQVTEAWTYAPLYLAYDPAFEDRLDTLKSVGGIGLDASDTTSDTAVLTAVFDADGGSLTSITAWSGYDYFDELDIDFGPVPYLFQTEPQDFEQFSQEIRWASDTDGPLSFIAGAYYESSDLDNNKAVDADLTTLGFPLTPTTRMIGFDQDTTTWALFGQASWQLDDRWRISGGLRYTDEEKTAFQDLWFADFRTDIPNPPLGAIYASLGFGTPHEYLRTRSEDNVTYQLTAQFDATDNVSTYASVATGFKAGGFNEAEDSGNIDNFEFENEDSLTFEVGAKMTLADGKARLDVALFRTEFDDLQVSTFESVSFIVGNAAKATSQGVELDGRWLLGDHFTLSGSWTWLDSTYDYFPDAACTIEQLMATPPGVPCTQNLAGRPTLYAPKNAGRVALEWFDEFAGGHGISAELSLFHTDGFYLEQDLDRAEYQPAFRKWGLRLAWTSPSQTWGVALLGKNLGDEITRHHGSDVPILEGAHYSTVDRPRSIAVEVNWRY